MAVKICSPSHPFFLGGRITFVAAGVSGLYHTFTGSGKMWGDGGDDGGQMSDFDDEDFG
jgi:hypothetical protein